MSAVDNANQRLDAALSRLESALQTHMAARDAAGERVRLEQELSEVRAQFDSLKATSATVSQRLDTAIGTLKNILAD